MGIETAMPSGMLWMAMATAIATPRAMLSTAEVKVAMPSGKLWMPMASAVITPMRIRCGLRGWLSISSTMWASCGFSNEGTSRSMTPIRRMPAKKLATVTAVPVRTPHSAVSERFACWNSSTNET